MNKREKYRELMKKIKVGFKVRKNGEAHIDVSNRDSYIITEITSCKSRDEDSTIRSCPECIGRIRLDDNIPICCSYEYKFGLDIIEGDFISEEEFEI